MDSYDLDITQGTTFSLTIALTDSNGSPIDLNSYDVSGFVKYKFSDNLKLADLNATRIAPFESGIISISIPATGTASLPVTIARYDVEIYNTGSNPITSDKVLIGEVSIGPEATK